MQYDVFLNRVVELGGATTREEAAGITRTVLEDLGKRLKGGEPSDLAAELPPELKDPLLAHDDEEPVTDDLDAFLRRLASHLGDDVDPEQARPHARAVFATLSDAVSDGEIQDLRSQLPAAYAMLFE